MSGEWRAAPQYCCDLERFDAPDQAGEPWILCGESWMPDGQDLGALVDALETFLGFGNRFNRSYPEFFGARGVKSDADALPAVFHAKHGAWEDAAEAKILRAFWRFEEPVGFGGSEKIDHRFDADGHGA